MSKFKNVYLNIAYVHREDNRRECYSGNKAIRAFEKKELGEVTIKQPLTYKAPEGMTKREVATLVSYYLERYISNQTRSCRIKETIHKKPLFLYKNVRLLCRFRKESYCRY